MSTHLPVDHVILPVTDLAAAGDAFASAGFIVTPETRHSEAMGTANRCIMLDGCYIELLAVIAETPANRPWRRLLRDGPGLGGIALASRDIETTAADLAARAIRAEPVRHFSRTTDAGELRFSIIRIDPAETPGLQCLVCRHHTPDLLWRPDLLAHPNGATMLRQIALPEAEALDRFAGDPGIPVVSGAARLTLSGPHVAVHDLRSVCGLVVEIAAP